MTEERKQKLREIFKNYHHTLWLGLVRDNTISHKECIFLYSQKAKLDERRKQSSNSEIDRVAKSFGGEVLED